MRLQIQFTDSSLEIDCPVIPADVSFVMPVRMKMGDELCLEYAFAQPLTMEGKDYYFEEVDGIEPLFVFENGTERIIRGKVSMGDVTIHVQPRPVPKREEGTELQFKETGEYTWLVEELPEDADKIRIYYFGDKISVYHREKLIADQFYYGDFLEFYKPEGAGAVEIRIEPLKPEKDVYLECKRKNGGNLEKVQFFGKWRH